MSKKLYFVAVDGSEWGNRAADHAVNMAQETNAEVRLISVVPWKDVQPMVVDNAAHRPIDDDEAGLEAMERIITPIVSKHKTSDVKITSELHWGNPVDTINQLVQEASPDQVFAGRRGRSRVADLVIGSVANELAHTLDKPIVLVP